MGHLEEAWRVLRLRGEERGPRVAELLAEACLRTGRIDRALDVLEATVPMKARMYDASPPGGMAWIRAQRALARLYRSLGRESDARAREAEIRPLLSLADPALPVAAGLAP
jgi:hypothetical protein